MAQENRWYKNGTALLQEIDNAKVEPGMVLLWFLGQLGFVIKIHETVLYIDALLNDFADEKGNYRIYKPPFDIDKGIRADYFICTHNHGDHLNLDTILPQARANPQTRFIVPMPVRTVLTGAGVEEARVIGAREGEDIPLSPDISLSPVAAAHTDYEQDSNGNYTCLGYVIRGNGVGIYHAGDTLVTPRLVKTLQALKPIDIAILPVNGGDWKRTAEGIIGNMHIEDAVQLIQALDVDLAVPAHYDMMNNNSVNPAHFADVMYRTCPQQKYHIFALGEQFCYRK
ncbi:MBL fold metallo-hydrolase [Spirochaetia bacterium]|nr:MBL fold metallo-hydrolase [Spirochaetia bacterium]